MTTTYAQEIFNHAVLNLECGQKIAIPCHDKNHVNSLRVLLGKERYKFLASAKPEFDILITIQTTPPLQPMIILTKTHPLAAPIILDADNRPIGKLEVSHSQTISVQPGTTQAAEVERERINFLLRQEGKSEEEIKAYWGEEEKEDLSV